MKVFLTALAIFLTLNIFANITLAREATGNPLKAQLLPLTERKVESTRAANLTKRLATFRDKNKASIAARINDNFARVNANRTSEMLRHLERLSSILSRLESRVDGLTNKDTANFKTAALEAHTAIDLAKNAVILQSQKDYTINISSESKAKTEITTERQQLHADLKISHDLIMAAKQAILKALAEAVKLGGNK